MRSACLPRHPAVAYLFLVRPSVSLTVARVRTCGKMTHPHSNISRWPKPPSQSPIGVVKRNHALNLASRIKNAYLARTKSSAGFRIPECLIFFKKHGFNAG